MAIFSGEAENHSAFNGNERLTILAWPSPISFLLNRDTTSPSSFFIDSHHHVELKLSSSSLHLTELLHFLFPLVGCFRLCLRLPLCYCRRPVTLPATSINFGLQNHHHRLPLLPWSSSTPSPPSDTLLPSFSFWNRSTSVTVIKIEGSCCAKLWWLYQKLPLPSSLISGHGDGGEAAITAALLRRSSFRNLQLSGARRAPSSFGSGSVLQSQTCKCQSLLKSCLCWCSSVMLCRIPKLVFCYRSFDCYCLCFLPKL